MNTAKYIKKQLESIPLGKLFTYDDLGVDNNDFIAASKVLSRLVSKGTIKRYQKGVYYLPKQSVFGELKPDNSQLLQLYLFEKNKPIAYITGTSLYNQLGLTTQVSKVIRLASLDKEIKVNKGTLIIKPAKSYAPISKKNIPLLQLLDVAKDFKNIPDANRETIIRFLKNKITGFSSKERKEFVTLATSYPPKVAALIGAILESLGFAVLSQSLKQKINSLSTYSFGISPNQLPTIKNWNII